VRGVGLGGGPAGRVADHDGAAPGPRRRDGVVDDGGGIGALVLADDVRVGAVRPDLQLIGGRRAEGVGCAEQDLLPLLPELRRDLADGGRLADAVDTDDQHDGRRRGEIKPCVADVQHVGEHLAQRRSGVLRAFEMPLLYNRAQPGDGLVGRLDAEVGQDQALLELIEEIVVDLRDGKYAADGTGGLAQSLFEFYKKAHAASPVV